MSRRRAVVVLTVGVGALLGALGVSGASAAPPAGTDASEVTRWNQVAATTLAAVPGPNGGAPPAFQINMGMVQGAVYDAVNAIGPKQHRPYLLNRRTGARASIDAAVATAAYDVLSELVSTAPDRAPFPGRAGLLSTLSSAYAASLASIDDDSFKKQGIAIGHASAVAMLDAREGDGRFGPSPWVSNSAAGHWQPLSPGGVAALDPTPWVGQREAVPHPELLAVPFCATARARQPAVGDRVQRGQEPGPSHRLDPDRRADVHRQVVAKRTRSELERSRPAAHRTDRSRRGRQREAPRAAEPQRRGRGDQLLERQVPLRLLAAVERDSTSVGGRKRRHGARRDLDGAPHRAVSRVDLGTQLPRRGAHSPCCGCSSATTPWVGPSRSRAPPRTPEGRLCARSTRSRSRSPSSSRHASGLACTIAAGTWRARRLAGTSPTTGLRTTSSL